MRFPMKPSQLPASTGILPRVLPSAITVAMVSAEVCRPRTFSRSFMTFAGLKKCVPTTCAGRAVLAAMASMSSVEVLVARIACGAATRSSRANTSRFTARSSNTASITMSALERLGRDFEKRNRDAGVREVHGDAAAHGAGTDDRSRADRQGLGVGGKSGNAACLTFGKEHVRERLALRAVAALDEVLALESERVFLRA